jgi:hypothetical protein
VYGGCRWGEAISFDLVRVGPHDTPAFLLDLWNGGDRCCDESFIAVTGGRIAWITREWSGADGWVGAGARRLRTGAHCSRVLTYDAEHHWSKKMPGAIPGRGFARSLNRDLKRWGYKR